MERNDFSCRCQGKPLPLAFFFAAFAFVLLMCSFFVSALPHPQGATNLTVVNSSTAPMYPAQSSEAVAGNVTALDINGNSVTRSWQGYYGNVTGTIELANGNGDIFYNWSDLSPKGEVYATVNNSVVWSDIQCFNFTATGALNSTGEVPGETNQKGLNLTGLQSQYNISSTSADSVNNTFDLNGTGNHATFYTGSLEFSSGTCQSTRLYTNTGQSQSGEFEEVLLYDPSTNSVIFTSLLNQDILGFDNSPLDFEMLVLENGHGTNTAPTTYYFYMEIQ